MAIKDFLRNIYKYLYRDDIITKEIEKPIVKTKGELLLDFAITFINTDPTPKDEVPDETSCVFSLTTILNQYMKFPVLDYTPTLLSTLKNDKRFKESVEFKLGSIILSPTGSGNGSIQGHVGIITREGKILSNSSLTGLWTDKYDSISWIQRYSKKGGLDIHIFEVV